MFFYPRFILLLLLDCSLFHLDMRGTRRSIFIIGLEYFGKPQAYCAYDYGSIPDYLIPLRVLLPNASSDSREVPVKGMKMSYCTSKLSKPLSACSLSEI